MRELKLTGLRTPNYNRRADLVCFVNGLPLVFIELKAVYKNIRAGFDGNLRDYMDENVIAHAFHHNAFLIVSNGDIAPATARSPASGSTSPSGSGSTRRDKGSVDAEVLLNGMLAHDRLLDIVENFILFDESKPGATRKVVARNHQVLGVNHAVASVARQEELKREFPPEKRLAAPRGRTAAGTRASPKRRRRAGQAAGRGARRRCRRSSRRGRSRSSSGRIPTSAGSACSGTRRAAASPIRWRSSPRRCAASCRATSPSC